MEARWMGAAFTVADATSHGWTGINWRQVYRNVHRLQSRIVKAMQEGNKRKVRALQTILTRSLSGAMLAVKRVTEIKVTLPDPPETEGSLKGSSPVRGNAYAGFLGGWGLATVPGYPTLDGIDDVRPENKWFPPIQGKKRPNCTVQLGGSFL
jgi:hypothetical protein